MPPVVTFRKGQKEAILSILEAVEKGTKVVLLESPVGSGKSVVLSVVGRQLHRQKDWTGYYTTPQVNLVDQLRTDELVRPLIQPIVGSDNYPCVMVDPPDRQKLSVQEGWCVLGRPCPNCDGRGVIGYDKAHEFKCGECRGKQTVSFKCPVKMKECQYYIDRSRAARGHLATMTTAYLLRATMNSFSNTASSSSGDHDSNRAKFEPRDFLLVDEAHNIGEYASLLSIKIHEKRISSPVWDRDWYTEMVPLIRHPDSHFAESQAPEIRHILETMRATVMEAIRKEEATPSTDAKDKVVKFRKVRAWANLVEQLDAGMADIDDGSPWVAQKYEFQTRTGEKKEGLQLTPVLSRRLLQKRLWPLGRNLIVLSTATILDPIQYLRDAGLPTENFLHLRPESNFPPEKGPVYTHLTVDMTQRNQDANFPKALSYVQSIMNQFPDQRGVIHTVSYKLQRYIQTQMPQPWASRLVFHQSIDRTEVLIDWKKNSPPNSVLVAVAMEEGLDLKYDMARWQVILKCPFPNLGDRRVSARKNMADGQSWYRIQALRKLLQSFGRIVRSETDTGETWILDSSAVRLLQDNWSLIPEWAKDRLLAGQRETGGSAI